jgi:chromosome segregation ATPase
MQQKLESTELERTERERELTERATRAEGNLDLLKRNAKTRIEQLHAEVTALKSASSTNPAPATDALTEANATIARLERELEDQRVQLMELDSVKQHVIQLVDEKDQLEKRISVLDTQSTEPVLVSAESHTELHAEIESLKERLSEAQSAPHDASDRVAKLQQEVDVKQLRIDELESTVASLNAKPTASHAADGIFYSIAE